MSPIAKEKSQLTSTIAFHKPWYDSEDEEALVAAFRSGKLVGDGPSTQQASQELARLLGVSTALLTPSCTHALELAMMVLQLKPGDEVIVPSFTFVSTANCVLRQGARLILSDVSPSTLTMDVDDMARRITPRTRAIIPVAYAGVSPDVDAILALAQPRSITVVEDAAQSIGATYKGKPQGTTGDIGCFSFHETKNVSTGEGGAFVTNNEELASRAEIIREKGTNRKQFMLHMVDKYTWVDVGSSYLPSDLAGALLRTQLQKLKTIHLKRNRIHERYLEGLALLAESGALTFPTIPAETGSNFHIFYVLMRDEKTRNEAIQFFRERNIITTFHYLPLHLSPVGQKVLGYNAGDFPVTESVSGRLLRLPIYPALTDDEQTRVIETMKEFLK